MDHHEENRHSLLAVSDPAEASLAQSGVFEMEEAAVTQFLRHSTPPDPHLIGEELHPVDNEPHSFRSYRCSLHFLELVCCVSLFIFSQLLSALHAFERPIPFQLLETGDYVRNLNYGESLEHFETVSTFMLIVLSGIIPVGLQVGLSWTLAGGLRAVHGTLCTYLVAFSLRNISTNSVKLYCGYLRPVCYEICQPDANYEFCQSGGDDMRQSFPSGHASQAFCGLTLLTLFLHNHFGIPSVRGTLNVTSSSLHIQYAQKPTRFRLFSVLSLIPMGIALFIAASRVRDNRHFPADVVGGSILGTGIAFFCYGLWF
jgi:membrane-associated phospholipid phosphatase